MWQETSRAVGSEARVDFAPHRMTSTPAPTEVVERVGPKRVQPPTVAQDVTCRRAVTLAFWAVALLGVPYWWSTTTIERLPLPTTDILTWSHRAVRSSLTPSPPPES